MVEGWGGGGEGGGPLVYSIKFNKGRFRPEIQPPTYIKQNIVSFSYTSKINQRLAFFPVASKILDSIASRC